MGVLVVGVCCVGGVVECVVCVGSVGCVGVRVCVEVLCVVCGWMSEVLLLSR